MAFLDLFQIATMGLGPGRTLLGDLSFGFLGVDVTVEVVENQVYGGGIQGTGTPERRSAYYTVHVKVTVHGKPHSQYFRMPKLLGAVTIDAYRAIKEQALRIRSWLVGRPLKKETQIKVYLKDKT